MFQTWLLKLPHPEVGCVALNMVCRECKDLMVELPKIVELWTEEFVHAGKLGEDLVKELKVDGYGKEAEKLEMAEHIRRVAVPA